MNISMALDPFANKTRGKPSQDVLTRHDTRDPNLTIQSAALEEIVDIFLKAPRKDSGSFFKYRDRFREKTKYAILNPKQINQLVQLRSVFDIDEKGKPRSSVYFGDFINVIIQHSYNAGHNGFTFHTYEDPIWSLGNHLKGTKKNPLKLEVYGLLGHHSLEYMHHVHARVIGEVPLGTGSHLTNCRLEIHGSVMGSQNLFIDHGINSFYEIHSSTPIHGTVAHVSKRCEVICYADVESIAGLGKKSRYTLYGNARYLIGTEKSCTITVHGTVDKAHFPIGGTLIDKFRYGFKNRIKYGSFNSLYETTDRDSFAMLYDSIGFFGRNLFFNRTRPIPSRDDAQ